MAAIYSGVIGEELLSGHNYKHIRLTFLIAVLGVMGIWGFNWILEPITTPKPPEISTELTKKQLFLQHLFAERSMKLRNVSRRMCKIGWEFHRKYCMRLIPYSFKWNAAKTFCTSIKAQLSMAFSRLYAKKYVIQSMKRFQMTKSYAAMGYYAHVEPPDPLDYAGIPELTVRNRKDVTPLVTVLRNYRFEEPAANNSRVVLLHRGKLFWMPPAHFAFPYCEYKRKPDEEPDRWEGYPDVDVPKKKKIQLFR